MGAVHAFVAEVLREFVHALEAAHDQPFQVELVGDAHIERDVEGVVVGDERTGRGAARDRLEDRGLHLEVAVFVEVVAHRADDLRAFLEDFADVRIDDQVDVAHAVAEFGVGEAVVDGAVGVGLHDREDAERFAEHRERGGVDGEGAGLRDEGVTLDADDVADVEESLEDGVVEGLVFAGADLVALDVDLDAAAVILQFDEGGGAHNAPAHHAAGNDDILEVLFFRIIASFDLRRRGVDGEFCGGVGVDAQFRKFLQRGAAIQFLFVEISDFHVVAC